MTEEPFAWVRPWDGDVSDEGKYIFVSSLDEIDEARESRDDYTPLYLHPPSEEAKERQAEWLTQVVRDAATPPAPEGWEEAVEDKAEWIKKWVAENPALADSLRSLIVKDAP